MPATTYTDVISTSSLPDSLRTIYSTDLEMTARPTLIYDQPAFIEDKMEFGSQRGSTCTWTVYRQLPASFAPLSETTDVLGASMQDYQVSFGINEYGYAIGTSEKLDLLSYQGPISNIVRTMLGPQMALSMDRVARNMMWYATNQTGGVSYKDYANNKANRYALGSGDNITSEAIRQIAFNLSIRRVPLMSGQDPSYVALAHPSIIYDLRGDANWRSAQLYAGSTNIFTGEEGMIHGVRFLKSDQARIANGGVMAAANNQTTLAANVAAGSNVINVTSAAGLAVGNEITLHSTGIAASATIGGSTVNWTAPDGTDTGSEEVIILSISGNAVTLRQKTMLAHSMGDFATEATDIYPVVFLGGLAPLGKGVAVAPEVRVSLPTDKLRRISYVGWFGLLGYGVIRDYAYEVYECTASVAGPQPYGF